MNTRWDLYCHGTDDAAWLSKCEDGLPGDFCVGFTPVCFAPPSPSRDSSCDSSRSVDELLADSLLAPGAVLDYGTTYAHFMQGLEDCTQPNVPIGLLYHDAVTSQKSLQFLPNTPHVVTSTSESQDAFYEVITARCVQ